MKPFLLCLLSLVVLNHLGAQTGFTNYSFSTGWSTSNSKLFNFSIEGAGNKKIHAGLSTEAIFFSTNTSKVSLESNKTFIAAGLFLKARLSNSRNFNQQVYAGANIGSDNKTTIWYPYAGLEQNFFLSPHTRFVLGEKCLYIFKIPADNWQPSFSLGFRFSF